MKTSRFLLALWIIVCGIWTPTVLADQEAMEQVVFYVAWYDVGKAALDGLPGVNKVTSGWHKFREINTVDYDPTIISVDEMVAVLKDAGTFNGIAK